VKPTGGTPNFKNYSKQVNLGRFFVLRVREEDTILIWGYAERYNPDLGVREYKKVENPCFKRLKPSVLRSQYISKECY
jgi:hypothetical protein